jgi:ribosome recycling factor
MILMTESRVHLSRCWHVFLVNFALHVQALDTIKKSSSSMPKDDVKRLKKEVSDYDNLNECMWPVNDHLTYMFHQVEELTKKFIKLADDMCKAKEKEISGN